MSHEHIAIQRPRFGRFGDTSHELAKGGDEIPIKSLSDYGSRLRTPESVDVSSGIVKVVMRYCGYC